MTKYLLILVAVLMAAPVWAQDTNPQPQPSAADIFVEKATTFANSTVYGSTTVKDLVPNYKGDVQSTANQQPRDNETQNSLIDSKYDSEKYWTMIETAWSSMMSKFNDTSKYPAPNTSLRTEFAEKAADLSKEFLKDMVYRDTEAQNLLNLASDSNALVNLYKSDFDNLKQQYEDHLKLLNADEQNAAGEKQWFDPLTLLDQAASDQARKKWGVRAELKFAGAYDKYLNYNIIQLVSRIKDMYSNRGYTQLARDLDWFLKVWGQANELNVMARQGFMDNPYNVGASGQMRWVGSSYLVNEYGMPQAETDSTTKNENTNSVEGLKGDDNLGLSTYALPDASYNNRSYGYYNGNYTTITVTVANRQYQLYDHLYTSPIVLDMDNDGKLEASNGEYLPHPYKNARLAEFDINGDGFVELTEWVGPNDGLLIAYKKGEDLSANQLFGEAGGYSDGFEKLSLLDTNKDKKLAGDELKTLSVWQDKNSNAQIEEGELTSVADLGITEISIDHKNLVASFVQNGTTKKMWDWFPSIFRAKKIK